MQHKDGQFLARYGVAPLGGEALRRRRGVFGVAQARRIDVEAATTADVRRGALQPTLLRIAVPHDGSKGESHARDPALSDTAPALGLPWRMTSRARRLWDRA